MKQTIRFLFAALVVIIHHAAVAQNVGVGNSDPQEKLHITGGILSDSIKIGTGTGRLRTEIAGPSGLAASVETFSTFEAQAVPGWQSFTAVSNALLDYVSLGYFTTVAIGELRIYEGEGVAGALLISVPMPDAVAGFNNSPVLNVRLQAGSKYTIWVANRAFWYAQTGNPYAGGRSDFFINNDMRFRVYTKNLTTVFNVSGNGAAQLLIDGGNLTTGTLQVTDGAGSGKVLLSDANGRATWANPGFWGFNGNAVTTNPVLGTTSNHPLTFVTNGQARMKIDNMSGNVGINTEPDAVYNFMVNGASKFISGIYNEGPMVVTGDIHLTGELLQHDLSVPALQNSWTTAPGLREPRFYKGRDGRINLQGSVRNGVSGVIFSLPMGYRPEAELRFTVPSTSASGFTTIKVDTFGSVICSSTGFITVSLDGISFRLD